MRSFSWMWETASASGTRNPARSAWPTTPFRPRRTSSTSGVNSMPGPGPGTKASPTRSPGASVSRKRSAALSTSRPLPRPMLPRSTSSRTSLPRGASSLLLKCAGRARGGAAGSRSRPTYSTDTRRRGLPSTSTWKSPGPSPSTGRPSASTTLASTATTSTPTPNTGAAAPAAPSGRLRRRPAGRTPPGVAATAIETFRILTSPGPSRDSPAAPGPRASFPPPRPGSCASLRPGPTSAGA